MYLLYIITQFRAKSIYCI